MNGNLVGSWEFRSQAHSFTYAPDWLESSVRRPISLSMPLRGESAPYRGDVVVNFFENLLPDSQEVRTTLQARLGADSKDPMALLEHLGRDCLGALQLLPFDVDGTKPNHIEGEVLGEADVAQILRDLPTSPMGFGGDSPFRLSLAGNHEKTGLLWHEGQWMRPLGATPTTHILKLPIGNTGQYDLKLSVKNEWLCHRLLQEFGLPVAPARIESFEEQRCLVVSRFDRRLVGERILRLPHEDFCQATGTPSALKYESDGGPGIRRCLELLSGSSKPQQDRELFFRTQILFWILCAIDGHAKNYSLSILPLGRFQMAPLYDVLSAYPVLGHGTGLLARQEATMAMAVWGKNRHYKWDSIMRRHWRKTAKDCGVTKCDELIDELTSMVEPVVRTVAKELSEDFPTEISAPIFEGMQRASQLLESCS